MGATVVHYVPIACIQNVSQTSERLIEICIILRVCGLLIYKKTFYFHVTYGGTAEFCSLT